MKFCLVVHLFICVLGRGECEVKICLFLCLFVGGRGMKVLVCWFACFGLVGVFGCLLVRCSNVQIQMQICTFAFFLSRPRSHGARPSDLHILIQIQISDSDSDLRSRIQICMFKKYIQQSQNNQTHKHTRPGSAGRAPREICTFKFRSQIQILDSIQISDLRFIFARS